MSDIKKNIALGAAAVGAGAVIAGATILGANPTVLTTPRNGGGSGGGNTVTVTVKEIHPSVTLTNPANGDVFLSAAVSIGSNFKDTPSVSYTLTTPLGKTCELSGYHDGTSAWTTQEGATHTATLDLTQCEANSYGSYKLTATAPGFDNVKDERTFNLSHFDLHHTMFDRNADPILIVNYGAGIGLVSISVSCGNSSEPVVVMDYVPENNEDHIDEVLLPFKNKNVAAGDCTATATAKKADGSPLNSQDVSGATVQKTFSYTGL